MGCVGGSARRFFRRRRSRKAMMATNINATGTPTAGPMIAPRGVEPESLLVAGVEADAACAVTWDVMTAVLSPPASWLITEVTITTLVPPVEEVVGRGDDDGDDDDDLRLEADVDVEVEVGEDVEEDLERRGGRPREDGEEPCDTAFLSSMENRSCVVSQHPGVGRLVSQQ